MSDLFLGMHPEVCSSVSRLLNDKRPVIVLIGGKSSSGKSSLAECISKLYQTKVLCSDVFINIDKDVVKQELTDFFLDVDGFDVVCFEGCVAYNLLTEVGLLYDLHIFINGTRIKSKCLSEEDTFFQENTIFVPAPEAVFSCEEDMLNEKSSADIVIDVD